MKWISLIAIIGSHVLSSTATAQVIADFSANRLLGVSLTGDRGTVGPAEDAPSFSIRLWSPGTLSAADAGFGQSPAAPVIAAIATTPRILLVIIPSFLCRLSFLLYRVAKAKKRQTRAEFAGNLSNCAISRHCNDAGAPLLTPNKPNGR
jgi:hypothetical protein